MRVTHRQLGSASSAAIQLALGRMVRSQTQLATQKRFDRVSEDPAAAADVLSLSSRLRDIEQFQRNADHALARLNSEEAVVAQTQDILVRAKELAMSVSEGNPTPAKRLTVKAEIDALFQQVVSAGNTKYGNAFLFGGELVDQPPFTVTGPGYTFTTSAPTTAPSVEVAPGAFVSTAHHAGQFLGDPTSGPLATLRDLSEALGTGDEAGILGALPKLDADIDRMNVLLGDLGGRLNAAESAKAGLAQLGHNAESLRGFLQDTDIAAAATELSRAQSAYQAALAATQRLLSLDLTSFLR